MEPNEANTSALGYSLGWCVSQWNMGTKNEDKDM